jgi:hypothetical protein
LVLFPFNKQGFDYLQIYLSSKKHAGKARFFAGLAMRLRFMAAMTFRLAIAHSMLLVHKEGLRYYKDKKGNDGDISR